MCAEVSIFSAGGACDAGQFATGVACRGRKLGSSGSSTLMAISGPRRCVWLGDSSPVDGDAILLFEVQSYLLSFWHGSPRRRVRHRPGIHSTPAACVSSARLLVRPLAIVVLPLSKTICVRRRWRQFVLLCCRLNSIPPRGPWSLGLPLWFSGRFGTWSSDGHTCPRCGPLTSPCLLANCGRMKTLSEGNGGSAGCHIGQAEG